MAVFDARCETAHAKLLSGKCPWCGRTVVDGRVSGQVSPPEWTSESRTIRFEFHGGCKDGQVVSGNASARDDETPGFQRYLYLTDGGSIGVRFDETPQNVADQMGLRALLEFLYAKDPKAIERLRKLLLLDSLDEKDRHAIQQRLQILLLLDSLYARDLHALEQRWQRLLLLDSLDEKDPHAIERLRKLLLHSIRARDLQALERLRELRRSFRQTYEVTNRDERSDEIVIRVDFVEQQKP
jgi:hypothetical protein